jgi:putative iron-dependent peroxidase
MKKLQGKSNEELEKIMGRHKNGKPLKPIPENSHLALAKVKYADTNGNIYIQEIYRQSLPWGQATGTQGLYFLAYSNSTLVFNRLLKRITQKQDPLLNFIVPQSANYFYIPSAQELKEMAG